MRKPEPANEASPSATDTEAGQVMSARDEIELIKKENLTGRQLRIARRVAQKHGLQVTSDLDAVRVLRNNGIDPFQSSNNMLKTAAGNELAATQSHLPATVRRTEVTEAAPLDHAQREIAVNQIQKDMIARRRRRIAALAVKLFCFIALPTILAGYYFYRVATPMYASYTQFLIQKADNPAIPGGISSFLKGSLLATAQDSIAVQGYLSSRDAMNRLNQDLGFKKAFQGDKVDPLQRLADNATNEATYKEYQKRVRIGFDPTEGIVKMEVVTPSPKLSYQFSKALINYAEQQVDRLTRRLRKDQMKGASAAYDQAEARFTTAQQKIIQLQEKLGVLSPEIEISAKMTLIQTLEADIQQKNLELIDLMDNPRPNKTKQTVLENSITSRQNMLKKLRDKLTQGNNSEASLARITAEIRSEQAQLIMRQKLLASAQVQLEVARTDANRQTRYLSMAVSPTVSDEPSYPKSFVNTLLAAIVFAGLYLMISLTASVLREQISN
jgi:capsular polysaccharide transport system permease protein